MTVRKILKNIAKETDITIDHITRTNPRRATLRLRSGTGFEGVEIKEVSLLFVRVDGPGMKGYIRLSAIDTVAPLSMTISKKG